jgi:hypothetical protein
MLAATLAPRLVIALALAPLSVAAPATAQTIAAADDGYVEAIRALQKDDARLHSIAWKLASANARWCGARDAAIGLLLYDVGNFARSDEVRRALAITGDIAIGAVAAGSPADAAGIVRGEAVVAIDGAEMSALPAVGRGDYARVDGLHDRIEAALARTGHVTLGLAAPGAKARNVTVTGASVCRSRFELLTAGQKARADGRRVQISRAVLTATPGDAEAASLIAHELAHNILDHRRRLAAVGRATRAIRATEREADRLAPWLMANAGYDPAAATRYRSTWGRRRDPGLFGTGTHDGWRDRVAVTESEVQAIARARAAAPGTALDWRSRFPEVALR